MSLLLNIDAALADLDKHASEFNFPVLDNAYVQMAATRMSVFRSSENWAVAFEVLGYSVNEGTFVDDFYAFGSCLRREGILDSAVVLLPNPEQPLVDPLTEAWIADWSDWSIVSGDQVYHFTPTRDHYLCAGIEVPGTSGPGTLEEAQLIRFFVSSEGANTLYMSEDALREALGDRMRLDMFLQTEDWQHPDIAGEEMPSMNLAMRSLFVALQEGASEMFQPGKVNTRWPLWASRDE